MDDSLTGVIKKLVPDKGFGFISGDDGIDRFFHRSDLVNGSGVYFPSDRCGCSHAAASHALSGGPRPHRTHCLSCNQCIKYLPAATPNTIQEGQRVSFSHRDDGKGPRADRVRPIAA